MSITTTLHQLGPIDRIPLGEARVFRVDGKDIAVFRCRSGNVFATGAECPHRGGPLADGLVGGESVICPMHGFAFDLRTGEAVGHECGRLAMHRVSITSTGDLTLEPA
jgi:nitrite reductase (NADH) small subunit